MAKVANANVDALVLGAHPCAHLAATLLAQNAGVRVAHAHVPGESTDDRLVGINPELFELDPLLDGLKNKLELGPVYGLRYLADDSATSSEFIGKTPATYIVSLRAFRDVTKKMLVESGADRIENDSLEIQHIDDDGVHVKLGKRSLVARVLIIAAPEIDADAKRVLGLPETWERGVVHRYSYVKCRGTRGITFGAKPTMPMSLDLFGELSWGWVLPGANAVQFAVEQTLEQAERRPPHVAMRHWLEVLVKHGVLSVKEVPGLDSMKTVDLPFAGALSQDDVANRSILIGPAGGFYTACAEDLYPCCWSAVFAADAVKKALKEKHLQDALQTFRHKWGATLGDYLRGPQQNLRFLLPLVYKNKMMTTRLSEAILYGKSVVR